MNDLIAHGLRKMRDKKSVEQGILLGIQTAVDAEGLGKVVKVERFFGLCFRVFSV